MSTSDLTRLMKMVDAAIAYELGDPHVTLEDLKNLGVDPRRTRNVAGTTIFSRAGRDADTYQAAAAYEEKMLRYRSSDRTLLKEKLGRAGIDPESVVILSTAVLDAVCDHHGQYRFAPRGDTVHMAATGILQAANDRAWTMAKEKASSASLTAWLTVIGLVFISLLLGHFVSPLFYIATAIVGIFGSIIAENEYGTPCKDTALEAIFVREEVAGHERAGDLISALWPTMREPKDGHDIRIDLGTPRYEVQDSLVMLERTRLPIQIAAGAENIRLKEAVADALLGIRTENTDTVGSPGNPERSPIVYVVEGLAAAVIQYGVFPVEDDVAKEIVNTMPLV